MPTAPNEQPCVTCLRMHAAGPCPPPDRIPEAKPATDDRPKSLTELIDEIRARVAVMPDEAPKGDAGTCDVCGMPREWREQYASGTGRMMSVSVCAVCDRLADLPEGFRSLSFGGEELAKRVKRRAAIGEAQAAATSRRVVLMGLSGHGKSSLVAAMLRWRAVEKRERNVFMHAKSLGLARSQHPLGEGEAPLVRLAMEARILVIDDVGLEPNLPTSAVPDVIFERAERAKATWITTGMKQEEVSQRYGEGIARRVFEGAKIIECGKAPS